MLHYANNFHKAAGNLPPFDDLKTWHSETILLYQEQNILIWCDGIPCLTQPPQSGHAVLPPFPATHKLQLFRLWRQWWQNQLHTPHTHTHTHNLTSSAPRHFLNTLKKTPENKSKTDALTFTASQRHRVISRQITDTRFSKLTLNLGMNNYFFQFCSQFKILCQTET
jgi:hypothetical protein